MPQLLQIVVDADGSEDREYAFDFSNYPELAVGGDSLVSSPPPVVTVISPPGQPGLILGTPIVVGPITTLQPPIAVGGVLVRIRAPFGAATGSKYLLCCTVSTAQGNILKRLGDFILVGSY